MEISVDEYAAYLASMLLITVLIAMVEG